ncbi:MAG: hypothetical protein Q8Q12_01515 [bacterium]|nr:hypothetical protein [bacterium]
MNRLSLVQTAAAIIAAAVTPVPQKQPPNLVLNGSLEQGTNSPLGWDMLPTDGSIRWVRSGGNPGGCIVFTMSRSVAEGPGMLYYSDFFPVTSGRKYVFSVDIKTDGPVPRPFVKGYALAPDVHGKIERRPFYQRQSPFSATDEWQTFTMTFTPKVIPAYRGRYDIQWARVMLYAYLNPGKIYFDNVSVRESPPEDDVPSPDGE